MKCEPTDVEYEAKKSDDPYWLADRTCIHCGKWFGEHWRTEDGKTYCVREVADAKELSI